ncbi:MAG: hypothetical protein NWE86_07310 [Candidatus Bathyarchaeota archaeon]|nr:hypothetical protein [Candidatus Bathyarchaeota archaeon]
MEKSWECPKCGRYYVPWQSKCNYCGSKKEAYIFSNDLMSNSLPDNTLY